MGTENNTGDVPATKRAKSKGGVIKVETMSLDQFRSYLKGIMSVDPLGDLIVSNGKRSLLSLIS
jgi:hypothetical protein